MRKYLIRERVREVRGASRVIFFVVEISQLEDDENQEKKWKNISSEKGWTRGTRCIACNFFSGWRWYVEIRRKSEKRSHQREGGREVRSASRAIRADLQLTWTVTYNPLLLPTYFLSKGKLRFCSHFYSNSGWTEVYQIQCKFLLMILNINAWLPLFNIFKSKTVLLGKGVSIA